LIQARGVSLVLAARDGTRVDALDQVDLMLGDGERVALLGPSASGKSTLLRALAGLAAPTSGLVTVDGVPLDGSDAAREARRSVGVLLQGPADQIVSGTVEREISFGLECRALDRSEMRARVEDALAALDLLPLRHRAPETLSPGEAIRVALAALKALRPRHLLLDEPTTYLDPGDRERRLGGLLEAAAGEGTAVLLVTQYPEEALLADRAVVLSGGRVAAEGSPREVLARSERETAWGLDLPPARRIARVVAEAGSRDAEEAWTERELVDALAPWPEGAQA
jgi:energy-coupling factor transport system ATP-binding protein